MNQSPPQNEQSGNGTKDIDQYNQDKAKYEAEKAMFEAKKSRHEAQTQATIASHIGTTKAGPYQGNVEIKDKAGDIEAQLLAAECGKKSGRSDSKKDTRQGRQTICF